MATDKDAQPTADPQFIQRIGALPIMTSALGQLASIYQYSKDSNRYVKYTLETAEAGVKTVAQTAMPVVANTLERPIGAIDSVACGQLSKLEEKFPIITKPTDEVVEQTKKVYETTLKPHMDTMTSVTQTSIEKVEAAKQYTMDTISATKQYTMDTVNSTMETVNSVKDFTTDKVSGVKEYTADMVATTASYGKEKLDAVLDTSTGQTVSSSADQLPEKTEQTKEEKSSELIETMKGEEMAMDVAAGTEPTKETSRIPTSASEMVRLHVYAKSMQDLENVQCRSEETLQRLNFTVDLIEYAKSSLDGAKAKVSATRTKFMDVWEKINQEEGAEIEISDLSIKSGDGAEGGSVDSAEDQQTLERRAIATARHLTSKLKKSFNTITTTGGAYLPTALQNQISSAKAFTENLYTSFTTAKTLDDVPTILLTQTRAQMSQLQETLTSYTEYIRTNYLASLTGSSGTDEMVENGDQKMDARSSPQVTERETAKSTP